MEQVEPQLENSGEVKSAKPEKKKLSKKSRRIFLVLMWLFLLAPTWGLILMIWVSGSNIPSFEELENPKSLLASTIYTADTKRHLNRNDFENPHPVQPFRLPQCVYP